MRRIFILSGTIILSLIMTFVFAEIFSLYHFGDIPTVLTLSYLITLFSIFEYLLLAVFYVIKKIMKKEKIGIKKIIGMVLLFIALIIILAFLLILNIDWLNSYAFSSPFYITIIVRCIEFLLPSILLISVSIFLLRKEK